MPNFTAGERVGGAIRIEALRRGSFRKEMGRNSAHKGKGVCWNNILSQENAFCPWRGGKKKKKRREYTGETNEAS